jgi:hypothetical protein
LIGSFLCGTAALSIAACSDEGIRGQYYVPNSGYGYGNGYGCGQFTACGACTLAIGCGWCSSSGAGACLSDPDQCGATSFSWTWEPSGCSGGTATDAGTTHPVSDAGAPKPADAGRD